MRVREATREEWVLIRCLRDDTAGAWLQQHRIAVPVSIHNFRELKEDVIAKSIYWQ
jgi:hypothetical protein